ncbi:MAG TPA: helical backbone metal receptor [Phnomibacter sp.]|nr:helical backbone metal receptor [Phnomibacter sp.]
MQLLNVLDKEMNAPAKRIVSLVPSLTETLQDLGLETETVGITKFCVHPDHWFNTKERIGGTKQVDIEKIKSLQPDFVIASKEENVQEQVEAIAQFCPVLLTDIVTLQDALDAIACIGRYTHKHMEAEKMVAGIQTAFSQLKGNGKKKAAYFMWRQPWMVAGGDTFIHHMMEAAGFENVFAFSTRYPQVTPEALEQLNPDYILLSSEPYPFSEKHKAEFEQVLPKAKLLLVDGEMFSWYGSRLLKSAAYFRTLNEIIH